MAHFAQLDENNTVTQVIVVNNSELIVEKVTTTDAGYINVATIESEEKGIAFCQSLYGAGTQWRQTSYNGSFRGKYAAIGDTYDAGAGEFSISSISSSYSTIKSVNSSIYSSIDSSSSPSYSSSKLEINL